jgi:hypothetical protein
VAALPLMLPRGEYALRGLPTVPDIVLVEIVDELFLPLVRGRAAKGSSLSADSPPCLASLA